MTRLGLAQYEAHATAARTEAERAAKAKALQVVLLIMCTAITVCRQCSACSQQHTELVVISS
jgi:hypothetical protein